MMGAAAVSLKNQPNQPLQTLAIAGVLPEPVGFDIGFANQQTLLNSGIALAVRGPGGVPQILRAVTTYQVNAYGVPDQSYLDTETMFTLMAVIRRLKAAITQQFPRALLADDGTRLAPTPAGGVPFVVTPSIARGMLIAEYNNLVAANLCEDAQQFAAGLVVQRNANDNSRLDVLFDPYLVSGLRIFATLTQFHFQATQASAA
jgi:phage tail sheath gpL-like